MLCRLIAPRVKMPPGTRARLPRRRFRPPDFIRFGVKPVLLSFRRSRLLPHTFRVVALTISARRRRAVDRAVLETLGPPASPAPHTCKNRHYHRCDQHSVERSEAAVGKIGRVSTKWRLLVSQGGQSEFELLLLLSSRVSCFTSCNKVLHRTNCGETKKVERARLRLPPHHFLSYPSI